MAPPRVDARAHGAVTPENPWLGLQSFDEDTRTYFFGREDAVVELCERIRHKTLTILFSQSGIGKTSILRAGVIPTLRNDGYTPAFIRFDYGDHAPSLEAQLLAALAPTVPAIGDAPVDSLWLAAHDPTSGLLSVAAPKFVLIIDQFEEIFTLGDRPGRRPASQAFIDALACLVENRVPSGLRQQLEGDEDLAERLDYAARPIKIVLSLREDFLHALERWRRVMPSLMDNRFELGPLNGPQALRAVLDPGRRRCVEHPEMRPIIDRDDATLIVAFVAGAPPETPLEAIEAVPPLLSLLCAELNHERLRSGGETIRFERGSERPDAILENFYESAVAAYPSVVRAFIEDRLLSSDGYRESAALSTGVSHIESGGMPHDGAVQALDELVDARLLVVEERDGVRRLELAHDVLCPIVRRRRDARHELEADAQRREKAESRRRQHQRVLLAVLAVVGGIAVVATILSVWALQERNRAEKALRALSDERLTRRLGKLALVASTEKSVGFDFKELETVEDVKLMNWPQPRERFFYERADMSDPYLVSFNHRSHLRYMSTSRAEEPLRLGGAAAQKDQGCLFCHAIARGSFLPFSYNRHCALCHPLEVWLPSTRVHERKLFLKEDEIEGDPRPRRRLRRILPEEEEFPRGTKIPEVTIQFPHADSTVLTGLRKRDMVRSIVAATLEERGFKAAAELVRDPGVDITRLNFDRQLFRLCRQCHDSVMPKQIPPTGELAQIVARNRVTVWLAPGIFEHSSHSELACQQCHSVDMSTETADINLPPSSTCRSCHERNRLPLWPARAPW